jgi:hypothetical protein
MKNEIQQELNNRNQELFSFFNEEDKKKVEAINIAVKALVDAGVLFYLFPLLNNGDNKEMVWQWNSSAALVKYASDGKVDKEFLMKHNNLHFGLIWQIYCIAVGQSIFKDCSDKWERFKEMMEKCYGIKNLQRPNNIEDLLEEHEKPE